MAKYITDLTERASSTFASGDVIEMWYAAGGSNRSQKLRLDRFAMLAIANTFTENQTISKVDATLTLTPASGKGSVSIGSADNGSSWGGNFVAGRNSNGSTPAGGFMVYVNRGGTSYYHWVDNTGAVRVGTSIPTNANDTSGTVVGAQTSNLASKHILGAPNEGMLWQRIAKGADSVRRFVYKNGAFNGEEFSGVVVDYVPEYGMDNGKSLNEINILGDLLLAVRTLNERIAALEGE